MTNRLFFIKKRILGREINELTVRCKNLMLSVLDFFISVTSANKKVSHKLKSRNL